MSVLRSIYSESLPPESIRPAKKAPVISAILNHSSAA